MSYVLQQKHHTYINYDVNRLANVWVLSSGKYIHSLKGLKFFLVVGLGSRFLLLLPSLLPSIQRSGGAPGSLQAFRVQMWYFQTEQGSNPEPRASEEDALSTLPTPHGLLVRAFKLVFLLISLILRCKVIQKISIIQS